MTANMKSRGSFSKVLKSKEPEPEPSSFHRGDNYFVTAERATDSFMLTKRHAYKHI